MLGQDVQQNVNVEQLLQLKSEWCSLPVQQEPIEQEISQARKVYNNGV